MFTKLRLTSFMKVNLMWKIYALHIFIGVFRTSFAAKEGRLWEYCPDETFDPECAEDEVIVMEKALYGHIKLGRCVDEDLVGHLGCYTDQLSVMDRKCSGSNKCMVHFKESDMEGEFPCTLSKALARYLEADYKCQRVYNQNSRCNTPQSMPASSRDQFLSSRKLTALGCGLESTPLILEAKEQQRINVTLIDFNWRVTSRDESPVKCPLKYGYMMDMNTNDVIPLCGGLVRDRPLFLSQGHAVQIVLSTAEQNGPAPNFLIMFKAVGCPKFSPPPNTWMKETNDDITIGCTGSGEKWRMRCIGNYWLGPQKDCSQYAKETEIISAQSSSVDRNHVMGMPPVVAFSVFGGVFLILASVLITTVIGILCIRSKRSKSSNDNQYYLTATKPVHLNGTLTADQFPTYRSVQVKLPKKKKQEHTSLQNQPQPNLLGSQITLPSLGSVPRRPPSVRESPHYYLLEGRDTTETEPLYDVVYQGLPTQDVA